MTGNGSRVYYAIQTSQKGGQDIAEHVLVKQMADLHVGIPVTRAKAIRGIRHIVGDHLFAKARAKHLSAGVIVMNGHSIRLAPRAGFGYSVAMKVDSARLMIDSAE